MKPDSIAWLVIGYCCLVALTLCGVAHSSAPSLTDRLVAVQPSLAGKQDEPVDPLELAQAIVSVPRVSREWAALILTIAAHESALSARIAANKCRPQECDHGKAFGLYQQHKNKLNAEVWGSPDIRVQTTEAARALRSAFYTCNHGALRPDWVARTVNAYAGHSCDAVWPGLKMRLATFERVRRSL